MMGKLTWYQYFRGLWRIWWGFCPLCNSDAPEIDCCLFCMGHREWRNMAQRKSLKSYWSWYWNRSRV